jgi:branched-chain amino acid transport system permease protein
MNYLRGYLPDFSKMLIGFIVLATVPLWINGIGLYDYLAIEIAIWCIYALGYNLALGYTGLPSFGHGAFFGIGAYAMAIYQAHWDGQSLWIGLALAILGGVLAGGLTGAFISHRRGIYFSLLTIAFGQMFWFLSIKLRDITKGEDGLLGLQRLPAEFGLFSIDIADDVNLYFFTLVILALVVVGLWILIHSPFGYIIQALDQNETRARFLGYNAHRFKWVSFTLSTAISALAGGLFALAQRSAFPNVMALNWSGIVVMMTIIGGGLVSFWGPLIGVVFYFILRDVLGVVTPTWTLWFGLTFMLVIIFQPDGIAGVWNRFRGKGRSSASIERLLSTEDESTSETAKTQV